MTALRADLSDQELTPKIMSVLNASEWRADSALAIFPVSTVQDTYYLDIIVDAAVTIKPETNDGTNIRIVAVAVQESDPPLISNWDVIMEDSRITVSLTASDLEGVTGVELNYSWERQVGPDLIINGGSVNMSSLGGEVWTATIPRGFPNATEVVLGAIATDSNGDANAEPQTYPFNPFLVDHEKGITIITHGFERPELIRLLPPYAIDMSISILKLAKSGRLWYFDADNDTIRDVTSICVNDLDACGSSIGLLPSDPLEFQISTDGEQVILVDWSEKSNHRTPGYAEATGHALYSLLMGGAPGPEGIGSGHPASFIGDSVDPKPLHFIGFSFGTIVNSEAIKRLAAFTPEVTVKQMTTLDAHDWVEGFPTDGGVLTPNVQIWENVETADNYYLRSTGNILASRPSGRAIPGSSRDGPLGFEPPPYWGFDLEDYWCFSNWDTEAACLEEFEIEPVPKLYGVHYRVRQFFHGTIEPALVGRVIGDALEPFRVWEDWYQNGEFEYGYAYSRLGGSNFPEHFSSDCRLSPFIDLRNIPIDCRSPEFNLNGEIDIYVDPIPLELFDGDFLYSDGDGLNREGDSLIPARPGFKNMPMVNEWPEGSGEYVAVLAIGNSAFETHLTYLPTDATNLTFDLQMEFGLGGSDDTLHVVLRAADGMFFEQIISMEDRPMSTYSFAIPDDIVGKTVSILFDLKGNPVLGSTARIDNIEIERAGSGPPEISLSVAGSCPGPGILNVTGATPNGQVAVAWSPTQGPFEIPSGVCAGTTLELAIPKLVTVRTADGSGNTSRSANIPAGACGVHLQALDITSCLPSNLITIP